MTIPTVEQGPDNDADKDLTLQVSSISGCVTLLGFYGASVKACYRVESDGVRVSAELETPFGNVELGSGKLTAQDNEVSIGAGVDGFRATLSAKFDPTARSIEFCASIRYKIPLDGTETKRGCTTVQL